MTKYCKNCRIKFQTYRKQSVHCSNKCRYHFTPSERFFKYIKKTESCWLWTGGFIIGGYGKFWINGKGIIRAHRYSWEIHFGKIPKGLFVLHRCDNPPCVNPKHLFIGNHTDNMQDSCKKGRRPYGENHPISKLTEKDVIEIRNIYSTIKSSFIKLSKQFNVSPSTIDNVVKNKIWKHINP